MAHPKLRHSQAMPSVIIGGPSFAPALTKSEHRDRIVQWTKSVNPQTGTLQQEDQTVAQSLLIDEGVHKLRHWDREMRTIGESYNDLHFQDHNNGPISPTAKLNLIADLNNIKKAVDPEDKITPRIIIQEFQNFMDSKRSTEPKRNKNTSYHPEISALDKRVKFRTYEQDGETRDLKEHSLNVGFTVTYPKKESTEDKPSSDKHLSNEVDNNTKPPRPLQLKVNNDPDWWKRKLRQGFIQTDEMLTKLTSQRKEEERIINGGPSMGGKNVLKFPTLEASIAAKATRLERQRLDRSMERLRQRHEDCFGCAVQNDTENASSASTTKRQKSRGEASKNSMPQESHKDSAPTSKPVTPRHDDPTVTTVPPAKGRGYTAQMDKLLAFSNPNPRSSKVVEYDKNKVPIFKPPPTSQKTRGAKPAEVQIIFERNPDNNQTYKNPNLFSSENKMGSARWPNEYLKQQRPEIRPLTAGATGPKQTFQPLVQQRHKTENNNQWVRDFVEAHKKKIKKDQTERQAILAKRKTETSEMYKEILFNKTRLQNEVEIERRKMQMSWKFNGGFGPGGPAQQGYHDKKLPNRFTPYKEESEVNKGPKEPLRYSWKERPKGLNLWLEGVIAKAKEDKAAKQKRKETMVPLSSYQF